MKKLMLSLFLGILFVGFVVAGNTCEDADDLDYFSAGNTIVTADQSGSLTVSDGCLSDTVALLKGPASVTIQALLDSMVVAEVITEDMITNENILLEGYCPSPIPEDLGNPLPFQTAYECPNGCNNGACIELTPEPIETTCSDSEGSVDDYFSKGTVTIENVGLASVTDICLSEIIEGDSSNILSQTLVDAEIITSSQLDDPNILIESYCPSPVPESLSDLRPFQKAHICDFGCGNGACLEELKESNNANTNEGGEDSNENVDDNNDGEIIININNTNNVENTNEQNVSFFTKIINWFKRLFGG